MHARMRRQHECSNRRCDRGLARQRWEKRPPRARLAYADCCPDQPNCRTDTSKGDGKPDMSTNMMVENKNRAICKASVNADRTRGGKSDRSGRAGSLLSLHKDTHSTAHIARTQREPMPCPHWSGERSTRIARPGSLDPDRSPPCDLWLLTRLCSTCRAGRELHGNG